MWVKGEHDGRLILRMSFLDKLLNDRLMTAMNAIEYTDGEVGILKVEIFERMIMIHKKKICHRATEFSEFFSKVSVNSVANGLVLKILFGSKEDFFRLPFLGAVFVNGQFHEREPFPGLYRLPWLSHEDRGVQLRLRQGSAQQQANHQVLLLQGSNIDTSCLQ